MRGDLVGQTHSGLPAYRYIRQADKVPTYEQTLGKTFAEIVCPVKLFNPCGAGTWWIAAYDPEDNLAWGVAELHTREVGSFSMEELVSLRLRFNLRIERDLHYRAQTIAQLI